jgi:dihydroneopterin aldolase
VRDVVYGLGFTYDCQIGFHEHEQHITQQLEIDFDAHTDWRAAARSDSPVDIVDYAVASEAIGELLESRRWNLIEAVAEAVAELLCARFSVARVRVRVTKRPIDMPRARGVAAECWREPSDFT